MRSLSPSQTKLEADLFEAVRSLLPLSREIHSPSPPASQFRNNAIGSAFSTNAFLPLLRAGAAKRVVTISSGLGDPEFVIGSGWTAGMAYSVSKAALNMVVAQFAAALRPEGFTCLAISPGLVNTAEKPRTYL